MFSAGKVASGRLLPRCRSVDRALRTIRGAVGENLKGNRGGDVFLRDADGLSLLERAETRPPDPSPSQIDQTESSKIPTFREWGNCEWLMKGCEMGKGLRIAVLLSGGVDSSVALALLKAAGHDVHAFYLQIWFQEDFRNFWSACPWEEDLEYAKQVCELLDVPLEVVPFTKEYWDRVVAHSIKEIQDGRTPNPDMMCNSRVKFGAFYEFLDSSKEPFDRVASGHYACAKRSEEGVQLCLTPDLVKDQTYFLANLTQEQLNRTLFPLGFFMKDEVRMLAAAAQLPTQSRKDSQGICFLGKVKFDEFVEEHLGRWQGLIVEEESGNPLGFHNGYWFHTTGQRTGLKLPDGPWYVVRKDIDWNVVYASKHYSSEDKLRNEFYCTSLNWLRKPNWSNKIYCKVRHGPEMYTCEVAEAAEGKIRVHLDGKDQGLAPGQYAVFYQDRICLGCGVIDAACT
ncbi:hypothetical protein BSKO_00537 [Bryopsis sp. KO-2023]|nr:hypothetical protein BSKO_00537 [Bryopsis sp. KO-2023]